MVLTAFTDPRPSFPPSLRSRAARTFLERDRDRTLRQERRQRNPELCDRLGMRSTRGTYFRRCVCKTLGRDSAARLAIRTQGACARSRAFV